MVQTHKWNTSKQKLKGKTNRTKKKKKSWSHKEKEETNETNSSKTKMNATWPRTKVTQTYCKIKLQESRREENQSTKPFVLTCNMEDENMFVGKSCAIIFNSLLAQPKPKILRFPQEFTNITKEKEKNKETCVVACKDKEVEKEEIGTPNLIATMSLFCPNLTLPNL